MADTVRVLRVELTGGSEGLQKSLKDAAGAAGRMGVEIGAVQGKLNLITAAKPSAEMKALELAVRGLGGTANLSGGQLGRLSVEVNKLAAAGAKVPASLSGLTGMGPKLGAAFMSLTTGGGVTGALTALGPAGVAAAAGLGAITLAGGAAVREIAGLAQKAEDWTNVSEATGLGVESVQRLQDFLEDAGFSADDLGKMMKKLQVEITTGGKDFERFGISLAAIRDLAPEEQLRAVAQAVTSIIDPTERAAAAQAFFGKSGAEHMAALRGIASGAYQEMAALTSKQVEELKRVDDQLDQAARTWTNWKKGALSAAAEVFNFFSKPLLIGGGEVRWGGVGGLAGGFAELNRISNPATYLDTTSLTLGPQEEETKKRAAEAQAEAKKSAEEMLAVRKKYNELQVSIVKATSDEASLMRDLDTMSAQAYEEFKAIQPLIPKPSDQRLRGGDMLPSLGGSGLWTRYQDVLDEENQNAADKAKVAAVETKDFGKELVNLAEIMQGFGGTLGVVAAGIIGLGGSLSVFQKLGTVGGKFSFGNLGASLKTQEGRDAAGQAIAAGGGAIAGMFGKDSVAGGTIGGAASGAATGMMIAGPWGALAGGVIGGAMGFFKSSKLKKEAKEAGTILGKSVSVEQLKAMKEEAKAAGMDWKEYLKKQKAEEEKAKKVEARQKLEEGLGQAAQSAQSLMGRIADGSVKSSAAIEKLFGVVNENLMKYGLGTIDPRLTGSKEFMGAQGAAQDVAGMLGGMRTAGVIDTGVSALGAQAAEDLRLQAEQAAAAQGLDAAGATRAGLIAIAPVLREQLNASVQSGKALDAKTQALLDEAKANGIEILADPALEQLDVAREQLGVLKQIAGGGPPGSDNTSQDSVPRGPQGGPLTDLPSFASGGIGDFGRGAAAMLHGREAIIPLDRMGAGGIGTTIIQNLAVNENPLQTYEGVRQQRAFTAREFHRQAQRSLASAIAAGGA